VGRAQQVDSGAEQVKQLWASLDVLPQSDLDHLLVEIYDCRHEPDKKVSLYATLVQDQQLDQIVQTIVQVRG
jgi:hypothetical protein